MELMEIPCPIGAFTTAGVNMALLRQTYRLRSVGREDFLSEAGRALFRLGEVFSIAITELRTGHGPVSMSLPIGSERAADIYTCR